MLISIVDDEVRLADGIRRGEYKVPFGRIVVLMAILTAVGA
jgi:hypothetical protein